MGSIQLAIPLRDVLEDGSAIDVVIQRQGRRTRATAPMRTSSERVRKRRECNVRITRERLDNGSGIGASAT